MFTKESSQAKILTLCWKVWTISNLQLKIWIHMSSNFIGNLDQLVSPKKKIQINVFFLKLKCKQQKMCVKLQTCF
jgi:hypothetical protein